MKFNFKFCFWKIKKMFSRIIILNIKMCRLAFDKKCKSIYSDFKSIIKEVFIAALNFLIILLIVYAFINVEKILFLNQRVCGFFKANQLLFCKADFFNYLIASLGISGFLTALFYSNLLGVFSTKYATLDRSLSFEIMKEQTNKRNIKSIKNYIITNIVLIMLYMLDNSRSYLIEYGFFIYTAKIIITFISSSQRMFYFIDLNFITQKECSELFETFNNVCVKSQNYDSLVVQEESRMKAKKNIENLNKLLETFKKEKDYNAIYSFEEIIMTTLYNYMMIRNTIPYYSLWFEKKYKQKSFFEMNEIDISSYLNGGVVPTPDVIKNENWVEEELFKLISLGIIELVENDRLINTYKLMTQLDKITTQIQIKGNIGEVIENEIKLCKLINQKFNYTESNSFYIQAILEMEIMFFLGTILKSREYVQQSVDTIDSIDFKKMSFEEIILNNLSYLNSEKIDCLYKKINVEKNIENRIITNNRYIKECFCALLYKDINDMFVTYKEIMKYIKDEVKRLEGKISYKATILFLIKSIEVYSKMKDSYRIIESIRNNLLKNKRDFIWVDNSPKELEKLMKKFRVDSIVDLINIVNIVDLQIIEKSEFDVFGFVFYNAYWLLNELLIEEDFEEFIKIYDKLFSFTTTISDKVKNIIELNGYNMKFALDKYMKPFLFYMDLQGKLIYYSRVTGDGRWEKIVKKQQEEIKKVSLYDYMIDCAKKTESLFNWNFLRGTMKQNFVDSILNRYVKDNSYDSIEKRKVESEDNIVKNFNLDDNEFYEIYLCEYVNKKSNNKYESKFGWYEE